MTVEMLRVLLIVAKIERGEKPRMMKRIFRLKVENENEVVAYRLVDEPTKYWVEVMIRRSKNVKERVVFATDSRVKLALIVGAHSLLAVFR